MRTSIKRALALLMALAVVCSLAFTFAGCHKSDKEEETTTAIVSADGTTKILTERTEATKPTGETTAEETTRAASTSASTTKKTTTAAAQNTTVSSGLFQVSQNYKDTHDYAVAVNTSQNIVIIYKKGLDGNYTLPVKAMVCSCGRAGHETPTGQYTTLQKQRWLYLIDGTYGQYCTKFKEHYWFHSVPYYSQDPSNLEWPEYNKLGSNASAGCVRLCVRDVKWIYDNLSLGTVVRVYSSGEKEPLAKPSSYQIDTSDSNTKRGWDPTDPDAANPYH